MYLQKISLVNYKNIELQSFIFQKKINCFVGENGIGKTNVLDAIYCLSFAKSYFNSVAVQNIMHGKDFFVIEGNYLLNGRNEKVVYSLKKGQKKVLKKNEKVYEKFADHIGKLPLVIISPADRDLITEGSEARRKFIDGVISQKNKSYLNSLISYNKAVKQRNALLKYFANHKTFDSLSLKAFDRQLIQYGAVIYEKRCVFLEQFKPIFNQKYSLISGSKEQVNLTYKSQLFCTSLKDLLAENLEKDKALQHTSVGVHKDDLSFEIEQRPIKKFGSQGQQKSYLIALKLAQFQFIKQQAAITPILLLDDIFDKLDETRVGQIINLVNKDEFGQIFITDTHADRTEKAIKQSNKEYQIFKL
ncbi:MAG: DNA replication/repair protein RecF [Tenacibaculum sp.]